MGLGIASLAIYFTLRNVPMDDFMEAFTGAQYLYLIPSTLLSAGIFMARALRWKILLYSIQPTKARELLSPMMIGQMGNMLPFRAGEILRAYLLKKKMNISFGSSLATIMVERMFDIVMLLTLISVMLVFHTEVFNSDISWLGNSLEDIIFSFGILTFCILTGLMVFIYLLVFQKRKLSPLLDYLLKFLPETFGEKIQYMIDSFALGLNSVRNPGNLLQAGLYSILEWTFAVLAYYPLCLAFDVQTNSFEALLLLAVIIPIFMTAFPTPGFLGSIQAAVFVALHKILGESAAVAAAFGMVAWGWGFLTQILAGLYFIFHDHLSVRQIVELEEEGEKLL